MSVHAVLFDLDGVLIDSAGAWLPLMNQAAEAFGVPPISEEAFARAFGQSMEEDVRMFYPGRTARELGAFFDANFAAQAPRLRVNPHAASVTERLREQGVRLAVITNMGGAMARQLIDDIELRFDAVIGATDVRHPKPAPDMVHRALQLIGGEHDHAIVVGDSIYDRRAAEAAGVRFAGFRIPGDLTLDSLEELLDIPEMGSSAR